MTMRAKGIHVIILRLFEINIKQTAQNAIDLIITLALKTAIIEKECLTKLRKFILVKPKYLFPLSDGIIGRIVSNLDKEPEKLLQVAFSFTNLFTVFFGNKVQLPNLIDFPVNTSVINLCNK